MTHSDGLRVLLAMVDGAGGIEGGHRRQLGETARALRDIGVAADTTTDPTVDASDYALVHVFSSDRSFIRGIRQCRKPVVLSSIYWDEAYIYDNSMKPAWERARYRVRLGGSLLRRGVVGTSKRVLTRSFERAMLFESVDAILPNSALERDAMVSDYGVTTPMRVVPNGVDVERFVPPEVGSPRAGVLYVGRIEPHKNQLGLIKALRGTGLALTIIGSDHPHHPQYAAECRRAAGPEVTFVAHTEDLTGHYQRARVHVLPSWFETTGLVSLEAAASGCNVVSTSRGYAREYFGDRVRYCDPGQPDRMRDVVLAAYDEQPHPGLREHVLQNFTWEHVAAATERAYRAVLQASSLDE